jgi:hypothetical protein
MPINQVLILVLDVWCELELIGWELSSCYNIGIIGTNLNLFHDQFYWCPCKMHFRGIYIIIFRLINWLFLGLLKQIHIISFKSNHFQKP